MQKKIGAANKLLNEYVDNYGRVTVIKANKTDPDNHVYCSENNHLWTGEASMLICLNSLINRDNYFKLMSNFTSSLKATVIMPGLYARQPEPYLHTEHYSSVSIDEYNGINFSQVSLDLQGGKGSKAIVNYGRLTGWVFKEQEPGVNPVKTAKWHEWIKAAQTLVKVIKHGIKSGDIDGSNSMDEIIYESALLEKLSRTRLPKDKYFMKIVAKEKTTWLEKLHYYLTAVHTVRKKHSLTSGKIMLFFKLETQRLLRFDNFVYNWVRKYCHKKLAAMYGDNYMEHLFQLYYTKDKEHPFHVLIEGMTLEEK